MSKGRRGNEVAEPLSKQGMRDERRPYVYVTGATERQWETLEPCLYIYGFDHVHAATTVLASTAREHAKAGKTVLRVAIEHDEYRFGVWEVDPHTGHTSLSVVATLGKRADVDVPAMNRLARGIDTVASRVTRGLVVKAGAPAPPNSNLRHTLGCVRVGL